MRRDVEWNEQAGFFQTKEGQVPSPDLELPALLAKLQELDERRGTADNDGGLDISIRNTRLFVFKFHRDWADMEVELELQMDMAMGEIDRTDLGEPRGPDSPHCDNALFFDLAIDPDPDCYFPPDTAGGDE